MSEPFSPVTPRFVAFTTSRLQGRDGTFDWEQTLQRNLLPLSVTPDDRSAFAAEAEGVVDDGFRLFRIRSAPCVLERPPAQPAVAPAILLVLVRAGSMEVLQNGRQASVPAGDGVICAAEQPFTMRFEQSHGLVAVLLPRSSLAAPGSLDEYVARRLCDGTPLGPVLSSFVFNLVVRAIETEPSRLARFVPVMSGLLAATLAGMPGQGTVQSRAGCRYGALERARRAAFAAVFGAGPK